MFINMCLFAFFEDYENYTFLRTSWAVLGVIKLLVIKVVI